MPPAAADPIRAHLPGCESCRAHLRRLAPALDVLPAAVEQRTPPARLRERLLATVRAEAAAEAEHLGERPRTEAARPPRTPWWRSLGGFSLRPASALAAAALLAAGAAGGSVLFGGEGGGEAEDHLVTVDVRPELENAVAATLERHGDSATLHVQQMPKLDPDEVYEVWVQRGGTMEPASVFVLRRDGTAAAAVPGPLAGVKAVLVTREPRGGSQQPTSPPLLRAPL